MRRLKKRLLGTTALVACALPAAFHAPGKAAATDVLVLRNAKVYTSPTAPPIAGGTVVVRGARILQVGKAVSVPPGARIIDCTGMVVTAGFQNSHVHFTEPRWENSGAQPADRLTAQLAAMFAMYGFTTVVDTGSVFANTSRLRGRVEAGEVAGPRIIPSIATLFPPKGLPIYVRGSQALKGWVPDEPETAEAAVAAVQRNKGEPKDILKLFTGSLVTYENIKPMPIEVARAAAAEAHREGRLVWAHPSNIEGVQVAMEAGVDVLAHTTSAPGAWSPELIANLVRRKMALVPTLKLWKYVTESAPDPAAGEGMLQNGIAQVRDFSRAGGRVLFGTDVGFMHDYDPADEYAYLARALTPVEILAALTTAPAEEFQEGDRRGQVAAGMDADLLVLGSDFAEDARNFADVRYTIRQGKILYPLKPLD